MKLKKYLSVFLALAMLLSCGLPVFADTVVDNSVAQVGETKYATLAAAIEAANEQENAIVTLLVDYDMEANEPGYGWTTAYVAADETTPRDNMIEISGTGLTFDLGGHTLSNLYNNTFKVTGENVTVQNGTMTIGTLYAGSYSKGKVTPYSTPRLCSYVILTDGAQNFTINDLTTTGGINVSDNTTATVNGLNFSGASYYAICSQENSNVTINGGTFDKATAGYANYLIWVDGETDSVMTIKGGTFLKGSAKFLVENDGVPVIYGGIFDFDPTAYVAAGCEAVALTGEDDGKWQVVDHNVAQVGETKYASLAAAVAAANAAASSDEIVITVLADIDFSAEEYAGYKWAGATYNPLTITRSNVTLDLGGHTISKMGNTALAFGNILAADGRIENVTIKNGTLLAGQTNNVTNSYVLGIAGVDGALIKDVTTNGGINVYTGSKDVVIDSCNVNGTKYYTVCAQCGSDVTIKGTTYTKNTDATVANKSMFWVDKAGTDSDMVTAANPTGAYSASSITIESGEFTVDLANGTFRLAGYTNPVVKGGIFNFDPTAYVATGYEAVVTGESEWTVGEVKASDLAKAAVAAEGFYATYTATKKVFDGDTTLFEGTPVTVNVKAVNAGEDIAASDTAVESVKIKKVLDSVIAAVGDAADNIDVAIQIVRDAPVEIVNDTITYEVHPVAKVYVNDVLDKTVDIDNEALTDDASFTVTLPVPDEIANKAVNGHIKVTHKSEDYDDEIKTYSLRCEAGAYYVQFTVTHFSEFELALDETGSALFTGHSISLNGYIDLNFYLNVTEDQVIAGEGTVVNFTWSNTGASYKLKTGDFVPGRGYRASVKIPAAEMNYSVHAVVTIDGAVQSETDDYSVRQYAVAILDSTSNTELATLIKTMLDYGAKAQDAFGRTNVPYANEGVEYTMGEVTTNMIDEAIAAANGGETADNMVDVGYQIGGTYYTSSLVYLSGCTLRHYFTGALDADQFTGVKSEYYYYIDVENIAAAQLDALQTFTVGEVTFKYSALDFARAIIGAYSAGNVNYNLAAATYWYNQAANAYFG